MHIGLIGGIGPTATVAYYTGLVTAFRDAGMDLNLTMSHADISVLADNAASDRADAQAQVFATHLAHLRDAGCDMGVITALTGHFCIEQTARLSPIPVLNAIDLIDETSGRTVLYLDEKTPTPGDNFGALDQVFSNLKRRRND